MVIHTANAWGVKPKQRLISKHFAAVSPGGPATIAGVIALHKNKSHACVNAICIY
jgi:hypothetical protein